VDSFRRCYIKVTKKVVHLPKGHKSKKIQSFRPLERQDRLHPKPVSNINSTKITDKEISLIWDPPAGDFDAFEVQYLDATGRLIQVDSHHAMQSYILLILIFTFMMNIELNRHKFHNHWETETFQKLHIYNHHKVG